MMYANEPSAGFVPYTVNGNDFASFGLAYFSNLSIASSRYDAIFLNSHFMWKGLVNPSLNLYFNSIQIKMQIKQLH